MIKGESIWNIDSIEEILNKVLQKEIGASEVVFASSGREDIDVKCLGKGIFISKIIFLVKELKYFKLNK